MYAPLLLTTQAGRRCHLLIRRQIHFITSKNVVFLSLYACGQDNSKRFRRILMILFGGWMCDRQQTDFGLDPDHDQSPGNFNCILPLRDTTGPTVRI